MFKTFLSKSSFRRLSSRWLIGNVVCCSMLITVAEAGCSRTLIAVFMHVTVKQSRTCDIFTLRAKLSGAVYCNRSGLFLFVCGFVCGSVTTITRNYVHQTGSVGEGSDHHQLIKFWPCPRGRGSAAQRKFLAPPYYSQRAVFASLWALFHFFLVFP